eukprot:GFUD01023291.1.p1 GENE.GFUD01023291.1~~GFUD01023291.1.p1  ORF type:complete len:141 (+),score=24.31 GFUD01023291.1:63-485(+)
MKLHLVLAILACTFVFTNGGSINKKESSNPTSPAPKGGRFALLARYLLPASCNECAKDVECVLEYCFPSIIWNLTVPECSGCLAYAARSCGKCLCEVIEAQLSPELSVQLCPYCPELEVCPAEGIQAPLDLQEYIVNNQA